MSVTWKDVLAKGAAMAKESLDFVKKEFQESTREENEGSGSERSLDEKKNKNILLKEEENLIQVMRIPKVDAEMSNACDFLKFFEYIPEFSKDCNWRIRFKVPYNYLQKSLQKEDRTFSNMFDYVWLDIPPTKKPPRYQGNYHVKISEEKCIRLDIDNLKKEVKNSPLQNPKIFTENKNSEKRFPNLPSENKTLNFNEVITPNSRRRADQDFVPSEECSTLLKDWGSNRDGSLKDLRTLLSTLQLVLWENSGWEAVKVSELMLSHKHVKVVFRKAMFTCHPDKIKSSDSETAWRAQIIFSTLTDANEVFKNCSN
eukprot:GHVP01047463.1.p2 GENE.GHVP01047463.1~~GHVP01047463.1.p2  ORF type:complete len:314 (-),score=71.07 GHVP01047463.1:1502-2443(-)